MKFRRTIASDARRIITERQDGDAWTEVGEPFSFASPFTIAHELTLLPAAARVAGADAMPIRPLSFRDFTIYERHMIDAARGLIGRFSPGVAGFVKVVEGITRKDFPLYRPKKLWYRQPIYYMSNALTFVPSGSVVRAPAYTSALDYELELGFVLGKELFNATSEAGEAAIGAFFLLNDFSARDVQRAEMESGFGPQKSKHFLSSMSSTAVTADEILPKLRELRGRVSINGDVVSETSSSGMQWRLGELLAHASRDERLFPGEIFGLGTMPGGSGMEIGRWLKSGDRLDLAIDGIGSVSHLIS